MNLMKKWSKEFCDEEVIFVKGDFEGQTGIFERVTGYINAWGAVCKIYIDSISESREFPQTFFDFIDDEIQFKWNNED